MKLTPTQRATDVLRQTPNWRDAAICAGSMYWLEADVEQQLDDCRACPVVRECLAHAIAIGQTGVVQGGMVIGTRPLTRITMAQGSTGLFWTVEE